MLFSLRNQVDRRLIRVKNRGKSMFRVLTVGKSAFALLIALVSAFAALVEGILPKYIPDPSTQVVVMGFVAAVSGAAVLYLATQEQVAPSP